MDSEVEWPDLFAQIGLDRAELEQRCRYLEWDAADAERLRAGAEGMEQAHVAFIDRLYAHLWRFETPARILRDEDTVERLKRKQRAHYRRLWSGPYDADYLRERLRVGMIHDQAGVDLKWYLGGYRLYLDSVLQRSFGTVGEAATYRSLLKAVFLDMALTIDTYGAAQRRALQASEARYARALRGANDGLWEWDVDHDRLYVSDRWAGMLGHAREAIGTSSADWHARVHPADLPDLRAAIDAHLRGGAPSLDHEYRIRHASGEYVWVLTRGVAERENGVLRMAGSQSDIGGRKRTEERLRHAARHDPLTGLANRARLEELLHGTTQRLARPGAREAALLFIDLDRFKLINDSLGHTVGDQVLVAVAERLSRCLRKGDQLVRFGGDEFVVLLDDLATQSDAEHVAEQLLKAVHQPLHVDERTLVISASVGIAPLGRDDGALDALQAADAALYRAKAAGKARFARFSDELRLVAQRQLELENALAQALERGEFQLHYQPICRWREGRLQCDGVEALLRWTRDGQPVPPQEFIPVLEESGGIVAVGEWALAESCRQLAAWQRSGLAGLRCAVNLSGRQLQRGEFPARVASILAGTGLSPSSLVLEITESLLMQDSADVLSSLRELERLGVRLALDDFGSGYSSLGYLRRFPLHILKVDRSFVGRGEDDPQQDAIRRAIIALGNSLGLDVVAEGVETEEQLHALDAEGCALFQGYWIARPMPADALEPVLRRLCAG
ncbi:EAL domain-containing protein [Xanthomonas sp. XNM01]|uniref:putative bifunctional diguanylate cyclase/phosphodiesterase n=1 Tax=Xanthomonas sp. XNM01 TaxID=2769289 RepID=UPI00177F6571|nr:EAL domain-containing protein [Xanthomonas sp. XNM01]MBD9369488.1 EAL domain-containing protein [Xanthomonas sp. XNM01]